MLHLSKSIKRYRGIKWLDSIIDSMDTSLSKLWDVVKDREAWGGGSQRFRHDLATEQQQQKARA